MYNKSDQRLCKVKTELVPFNIIVVMDFTQYTHKCLITIKCCILEQEFYNYFGNFCHYFYNFIKSLYFTSKG